MSDTTIPECKKIITMISTVEASNTERVPDYQNAPQPGGISVTDPQAIPQKNTPVIFPYLEATAKCLKNT